MAALARAGARFATQPLRGPACAVALVGDVGSAADPTGEGGRAARHESSLQRVHIFEQLLQVRRGSRDGKQNGERHRTLGFCEQRASEPFSCLIWSMRTRPFFAVPRVCAWPRRVPASANA